MDPRHPELVLPRVKALVEQYEGILGRIETATLSTQLGQCEREASLVIQELCMTAPRLHDALNQASRLKRKTIVNNFTYVAPEEEPTPRPVVEKVRITLDEEPTPAEIFYEVVEHVSKKLAEEVPTAPNQAETIIVEPKPRKKKTSKKKAEQWNTR